MVVNIYIYHKSHHFFFKDSSCNIILFAVLKSLGIGSVGLMYLFEG